MKFLLLISKKSKTLKWIFTPVGILLIGVRFFYGRKFELASDGSLNLSGLGVAFAIVGVAFTAFGLLCFAIDTEKK